MNTYILTIQLDCEEAEHPADYFDTDGTLKHAVLAVDKTRVLHYTEVKVPEKQRIPLIFNNSGNKVKKTPQKVSNNF